MGVSGINRSLRLANSAAELLNRLRGRDEAVRDLSISSCVLIFIMQQARLSIMRGKKLVGCTTTGAAMVVSLLKVGGSCSDYS